MQIDESLETIISISIHEYGVLTRHTAESKAFGNKHATRKTRKLKKTLLCLKSNEHDFK